MFSERFMRTTKSLLEQPIFENGKANWIDEINSVTKKYKNTKHSSNDLSASHGSLEKKEAYIHTNLLDRKRKIFQNLNKKNEL